MILGLVGMIEAAIPKIICAGNVDWIKMEGEKIVKNLERSDRVKEIVKISIRRETRDISME